MEIIKARKEHSEDVYKLICELEGCESDRQAFQNVYSRNLENNSIYYFLAAEDAQIIGFASLHIQHLLHHSARIGELQEIIVRRENRGTGAGKKLFDCIKKTAAVRGCLQLEISCRQTRTESHEFYLRQGAANTHFKFTMALTDCPEYISCTVHAPD